jgi:hypothetical protein
MPDEQKQWGDEKGEAPMPKAVPLLGKDSPPYEGYTPPDARTQRIVSNGCMILTILLVGLAVVFAICSFSVMRGI